MSDLFIGGGTLLLTDCSTFLLIDRATLLLISKMNNSYIFPDDSSFLIEKLKFKVPINSEAKSLKCQLQIRNLELGTDNNLCVFPNYIFHAQVY